MIEALVITLASKHFDPPVPVDYNERNLGVLVDATIQNQKVTFGGFKNSHHRDSYMLLARKELAGGLSVMGGLCTGYKSRLCGALRLDIGPAVITYAPRIGNYSAHTLGLAYRIDF
jgi:hypothetical protein